MTPEQLRDARRDLGLSQAELARALGLAKHGSRTIRRWEKGQWPVPGAVAIALEFMTAVRPTVAKRAR